MRTGMVDKGYVGSYSVPRGVMSSRVGPPLCILMGRFRLGDRCGWLEICIVSGTLTVLSSTATDTRTAGEPHRRDDRVIEPDQAVEVRSWRHHTSIVYNLAATMAQMLMRSRFEDLLSRAKFCSTKETLYVTGDIIWGWLRRLTF